MLEEFSTSCQLHRERIPGSLRLVSSGLSPRAPLLGADWPYLPVPIPIHTHDYNYMRSPVSSSSESSNLGVTGMPLTQLHFVKFYCLGWCLTRGYSQKVMSQNTFPGISFLGIWLENSYIPIYPFEERFKRNTWNHDVRKCETSNNLILLRKERDRERERANPGDCPYVLPYKSSLKYEKSVNFLQLPRT